MVVEGVLLGFKKSEEFAQAAQILEQSGVKVTSVDTLESAGFPYLSKDLGLEETELLFLTHGSVIAGLDEIRRFAATADPSE